MITDSWMGQGTKKVLGQQWQQGEVFLTGSWQCFGPWLEVMSSDEVGSDKLRPWRSLTLLPAYSSAKSENSLMVRNFGVCHLEIYKLQFWEIIHHVHCYMPLSSSYTHFNIYFNPSYLLGDRVLMLLGFCPCFNFCVLFFQVVEAICTQVGVW